MCQFTSAKVQGMRPESVRNFTNGVLPAFINCCLCSLLHSREHTGVPCRCLGPCASWVCAHDISWLGDGCEPNLDHLYEAQRLSYRGRGQTSRSPGVVLGTQYLKTRWLHFDQLYHGNYCIWTLPLSRLWNLETFSEIQDQSAFSDMMQAFLYINKVLSRLFLIH